VDVRQELAQGPHIGKLVAFSRDKVVGKSNEAIEELTMLSKYGAVFRSFAPGKLTFVSDELRKKIIDEGGLDSIVDNLAKPDHALFAVDALLPLMEYSKCSETFANKFDQTMFRRHQGTDTEQ
jgi:hypothetical protein